MAKNNNEKLKINNSLILGVLMLIFVLLIFISNLLKSEMVFSKNQKNDQRSIISESVCDKVLKETTLESVKMFEGKPAKVNFSKYPKLNLYRTTISRQVADGPNFAGHYTFVSWGCGTDCLIYTIIDSVTGTSLFDSGQIVQSASPFMSLDSRLLTFNSKDALKVFKGMTLNEIENKNIFLSKQGREYYELVEETDSQPWLHKLCTENALDGIYSY